MKKRYLALLLVLALALVACNPAATVDTEPATDAAGTTEAADVTEGDATEETAGGGTGSDLKVGMVTDEGGVNDQSFNQSAWEGMQRSKDELGVEISYVESQNESDYAPNFDTSLEQGNQLIWGIGFMLTEALNAAAEANPDTNYALVDSVATDGLMNAASVLFKAEQPSFLVGYIAAHMTESNNVGFIGGIEGDIIWGFEYGYRAGVAYGAKELGKEIEVQVQYANSFTDSAIGKAIAKTMYGNGADIIFSAAGDVGTGAIEESREAHSDDKHAYAIGVDRDQNYLSPDTVITSAVKRVDVGVFNVVKETVENGFPGGQVFTYGLQDGGAVDIAETSDKLVPADILAKVDLLKQEIIDEKIVVPFNEETFNTWLETQ